MDSNSPTDIQLLQVRNANCCAKPPLCNSNTLNVDCLYARLKTTIMGTCAAGGRRPEHLSA